ATHAWFARVTWSVQLIQDCKENEQNLRMFVADSLGKRGWHRYCSERMLENTYSYALTKNLTHEPAVGGVQSPSGQHPIIPAAVSNGHACNSDVIQDGRFQFSRATRVRGDRKSTRLN